MFKKILWPSVLLSFTLFHVVSLPLVLTYDSQLYVDQALMLGSPRFWSDWHFLRTPLLQLCTRIFFELFGEHRYSLLAVVAGLGFFGLLKLQSILQRWGGYHTAWIITLIIAAMPLFITYQHCFLSESGSFLFIVLIIISMLEVDASRYETKKSLFFGVLVATAYYYRPTLLVFAVLAPFTMILFIRPFDRRQFLKVCLLTFVLPHILSIPWKYIGRNTHWQEDQVIFGIINQAIPEVNSPYLGTAQPQYIEAMERSLVKGALSMSGIADGEIYQFIGLLQSQVRDRPGEYFFDVIRAHPLRYIKGVVRGGLFLMGAPGIDSDNTIFQKAVLEKGGAVIFPGPQRIESYIQQHFYQSAPPSNLFVKIFAADYFYTWLYRCGAFLLLPLLIYCYKLQYRELFIFSIVPFIFISYHAIVLFSLDRMIVPIAPLVVCIPLLGILKCFKNFFYDAQKQ